VRRQAWGLGYVGQPHILVRFMAIESFQQVPKARLIAMSWMVICLFGAISTGFFGIAFFQGTSQLTPQLAQLTENPEAVFILITQVVFNPWIAGFLLAAILAAIMSTIDSQLLICSGTITEDFYKKFFRRNATDKELVLTGRLAVVIIAVIAVWIAQDPKSQVLSLVSYAWAGFGASFGPVIVLSLLWRNMTRNAALFGMLVGAVTVVIWKQLSGGIFDLYELLPGFLFALTTIFLVSRLQTQSNPKILEQFDQVQQIFKG